MAIFRHLTRTITPTVKAYVVEDELMLEPMWCHRAVLLFCLQQEPHCCEEIDPQFCWRGPYLRQRA